MTTSDYNLRPLWDEILTVYDQISLICNRHQIRHWLAYGTLLGAARHSGFIPWDDDFDLMMPRIDYDSFIKVACSELPDGLEIVSLETVGTPSYNQPFAKIKVTNEALISKVSCQTKLNLVQGIFIDIFPMDGLPSACFLMHCFRMVRAILRRLYVPNQAWLLQKWAKQLNFDKSEYVGIGNCEASDFRKWHFPREWFSETIRLPFERIQAPVPIGYKNILEATYGNYMQLPPIESRHPKHQVL